MGPQSMLITDNSATACGLRPDSMSVHDAKDRDKKAFAE